MPEAVFEPQAQSCTCAHLSPLLFQLSLLLRLSVLTCAQATEGPERKKDPEDRHPAQCVSSLHKAREPEVRLEQAQDEEERDQGAEDDDVDQPVGAEAAEAVDIAVVIVVVVPTRPKAGVARVVGVVGTGRGGVGALSDVVFIIKIGAGWRRLERDGIWREVGRLHYIAIVQDTGRGGGGGELSLCS